MYIGDMASGTKRSITQAEEDYAQYSGKNEEETSIQKLIENRVETHLLNIYTLLQTWDNKFIMRGGIE